MQNLDKDRTQSTLSNGYPSSFNIQSTYF